MNMKPINIMIFGIAILIAFLIAILSYSRLHNRVKMEPKPVKNQLVAVASYDLSWGTSLGKDMIRLVPFLKESLPPGYFSDTSALENRVLLFPIKANQPIFESMLAPKTITTGGVAALVTPKKRAMSIKVDKVIGIAGFIHPGNRVDVLVTLQSKGKVDNPITKTVLENVLVLATGPELVKEGKQEKPVPVEVVTLEVTPEEGEKLALAITEGTLQLALRSYIDSDDVFTAGTTIPHLLASYRGIMQNAKTKSAQAKASVPSVQLIKGCTITEVYFDKGE